MSLVVFTALVGLAGRAGGSLHPVLAFTALLCIAVGAGAAGALNMWYDADIDAVMSRTARRPIPRGPRAAARSARLRPALAGRSRSMLGLRSNWLAAGAACLHDLLLRRHLHDVAQALDAAEHRHRRRGRRLPADDRLGRSHRHAVARAVLLFLIIFFWTPPHFWALALYSTDDYARAGMPMLPVVARRRKRRAGRSCSTSLILVPLGVAALACSASPARSTAYRGPQRRVHVRSRWRAARVTRADAADARRSSLFGFSIMYLFVIFAALLVDRDGGLIARWRT